MAARYRITATPKGPGGVFGCPAKRPYPSIVSLRIWLGVMP
ncbi:hypothetical protein FF80_03968 [Devosia sp. LC5]|nr:hypothetical protein FF80_03968 [Devosia sp. LC5]